MHLPEARGCTLAVRKCFPMKPGAFPLGSPQSRAAARAVLVAREADKLRFQVVSAVDGSRVNLDGLAEAVRAARMRAGGEESTAPFPASESGRDSLHERIMEARARVERMREG